LNWLVFHIVSGQAFFTGIAMVIGAAFVSMCRSTACSKRLTALFGAIGVLAIVTSSTAIPYGYYGAAGAVMLVWMLAIGRRSGCRWAASGVIAVWIGAACAEAPYHFVPPLRPVSQRSITVIGDSISAGMGAGDKAETWPRILARTRQVEVDDISHPGETAASALKRVQQHRIRSPVVVLEIGGNDLLGATSAARFADDLDALLTHLSAPDRQIVMFELPLPPFYHEYGRVQRTAASKHKVVLVPKRVLLSILAGEGATLDTIHLTQAGHQAMADRVWQLVQDAYK
jgi:acyl-CoA thioesterase-1